MAIFDWLVFCWTRDSFFINFICDQPDHISNVQFFICAQHLKKTIVPKRQIDDDCHGLTSTCGLKSIFTTQNTLPVE